MSEDPKKSGSENKNNNNDHEILNEVEINEIIEKLISSRDCSYEIRNLLQEKLRFNSLLCEKMIICLQNAVLAKDFGLADEIANGLVYSDDPAKVIRPIMDFLTDPDHDYDLGYNQGEMLAMMGPKAIPFISEELHRYRRTNDFVGVLGLSLIFQETGQGKEEILAYLNTLDNADRKRILLDSLLDDDFQ